MNRVAHTTEHDMFVRTLAARVDAPALVYLHGLGESGLCFEQLARHPALAAWRHVIPDLPGYGRSPWPAQPRDLVAVADWIAVWLRAREHGPAILVGHSMGGVLGVILAERHPEVVRALVNIEGNVSIGDCVFSGQAAALTVDALVDGGLAALAERVYADGANKPALRGYYASMRFADPRTFHQHSRDLVAASREETMGARLAALRVPLAYIAGVPDGIAPRSHELLAAHHIAVDAIGPAGHWPFIDQADATAAVIARAAAI
ncbi:MAG: alpha/beta hydrolase [Deltaproteobacteria bacterium]|nr:alpha/beta hydrolase [Deltaproteobacteria bacterium]